MSTNVNQYAEVAVKISIDQSAQGEISDSTANILDQISDQWKLFYVKLKDQYREVHDQFHSFDQKYLEIKQEQYKKSWEEIKKLSDQAGDQQSEKLKKMTSDLEKVTDFFVKQAGTKKQEDLNKKQEDVNQSKAKLGDDEDRAKKRSSPYEEKEKEAGTDFKEWAKDLEKASELLEKFKDKYQGLGAASTGLKDISQILDKKDVYSQQLSDLDSYYKEKTKTMNTQLEAEIELKSRQGASRDEITQTRVVGEEAIQREANQRETEEDQIKNQQKLQLASSTMGTMAGISLAFYEATGKHSKTAFAAYKAFSIAQAIIDTYKAAQGAYAALSWIPYVGPALGIAAAAAAIASGMARVKAIQAQQPGGSSSASGGEGGSSGSVSIGGSSTALESVQTSAQQQSKGIEIHIHGNVVDQAAFARELAPYISEAKGDKLSYGD